MPSSSPPPKPTKFPTRLRNLNLRGARAFKRVLNPRRSHTGGFLYNFILGAGHEPSAQPPSRPSVLSYGSLAAWNRLSMASLDPVVQTRLSCAHETPSPSPLSNTPSRGSSTLVADGYMPFPYADAIRAGSARSLDSRISPIRQDLFAENDPRQSESWSEYIDRVLQPDGCEPLLLEECPSELSAPASAAHHNEITCQGPSHYTGVAWETSEKGMLKAASSTKPKLSATMISPDLLKGASPVKKGAVKLVKIRKPKRQSPHSTDNDHGKTSLSSKDSVLNSVNTATTVKRPSQVEAKGKPATEIEAWSKAVATNNSIGDLRLDKPWVNANSDLNLHHDTLPYQPYRSNFDPFDEQSPSPPPRRPSITPKPRPRPISQVLATELDLHLNDKPLLNIERPWLTDTTLPYQPYRPHFDPFNEQSPTPPTRRPSIMPKPRPRPISQVLAAELDLHLGENPQPATPERSWLIDPTPPPTPKPSSPPASFDPRFGVLTRRLTNAGPSTPPRVVMNSSFPFFQRPPLQRRMEGLSAPRPPSRRLVVHRDDLRLPPRLLPLSLRPRGGSLRVRNAQRPGTAGRQQKRKGLSAIAEAGRGMVVGDGGVQGLRPGVVLRAERREGQRKVVEKTGFTRYYAPLKSCPPGVWDSLR